MDSIALSSFGISEVGGGGGGGLGAITLLTYISRIEGNYNMTKRTQVFQKDLFTKALNLKLNNHIFLTLGWINSYFLIW